MTIFIRRCTVEDILDLQECNLLTLPENYQLKYYIYHLIAWPQLSYIAVTSQGKIAGYVMGKLEEEDPTRLTGHFTSVAVKREYRRLGIAEKLLRQSMAAMVSVYGVKSISLHVRQSNLAAINLYSKKLGFEVFENEPKYYADGEDSYLMKWISGVNKVAT